MREKLSKLGFIPPALLGIFFVFSLYSRNIVLIPIKQVVLPTILVVCLAVSFYYLFYYALKSRGRACVLSFLLIASIFTYGYSWIASVVLLVVALVYAIIKIEKQWCIPALTILAACLLIAPLASIVGYHLLSNSSGSIANTPASQTSDNPSIYYIILDSYAGESTLSELGYDNSEFVSFLEENGFYVAQGSFCNYPRTYLSLASSLNMDYLQGKELDYRVGAQMIEDNKAVEFLKSHGYRYAHISTEMWGPTLDNRNADINYQYKPRNILLNEFSIALLKTTPLDLEVDIQVTEQRLARDVVLFQFETLNSIAAKGNSNTYVFCHILLPYHHLYLFNQDGSCPTLEECKITSIREQYTNHLSYVNKRVKETITNIMANSKEPPIIILQSDEGYYSDEFYEYVSQDSGELPDQELLRERAYILNALYLPSQPNTGLYEGISPVNTFRLVFNLYFQTDYDLLPDIFYFPEIFWGSGAVKPSSGFFDATELINRKAS